MTVLREWSRFRVIHSAGMENPIRVWVENTYGLDNVNSILAHSKMLEIVLNPVYRWQKPRRRCDGRIPIRAIGLLGAGNPFVFLCIFIEWSN